MAELDIGKHCGVSTCKQLDFLPFDCSSCGLTFCKEHRLPDSHECSHKQDNFSYPEFKGEKSYACEFLDCNGKELIKVVCNACNKIFCLAHRHQVDHKCAFFEEPTKRMEKTAAHVQKILDSRSTEGGQAKKTKGRKSKATAAKVTLMKLKLNAIGDKATPDCERIYLKVYLPEETKMKSKAMYFSNIWTVGRTVDKIAELTGIRNNNNVSGAKKLRLFDYDDRTTFEIDKSLKTFTESDGRLFNGGSVILEYVDDGIDTLNKDGAYKE